MMQSLQDYDNDVVTTTRNRRMRHKPRLMTYFFITLIVILAQNTLAAESVTNNSTYVRHKNNWALIVDTSRFWFNYRHIANALTFYHSVKRLGIPDSQIVLMLADGMPCNARNCFPGQVFNSQRKKINLYGTHVEVDYRGNAVSVANFIKVLTGRHAPGTPASQRLDSDENSNVFVYMTGHGGDEFLKFQDFEELSSPDIADAIEEMHVKKRYKELFFVVDTCQAGTLATALTSPNVLTAGSSKKDENSYAYGSDSTIGVSLIDRFTSATMDFLEKSGEEVTISELFKSYNPRTLHSHPDFRTDLYKRSLSSVPVTDFLGSVLHVTVTTDKYPLQRGVKSVIQKESISSFDIQPLDVLPSSGIIIKKPQTLLTMSNDFYVLCILFIPVLIAAAAKK